MYVEEKSLPGPLTIQLIVFYTLASNYSSAVTNTPSMPALYLVHGKNTARCSLLVYSAFETKK